MDHYICVPLSEPRPFSPFVRRASEETRGPSRHEMADYTLNASPRGLDGAQESTTEGERGAEKRKQGTRGGGDEINSRKDGANCRSKQIGGKRKQ